MVERILSNKVVQAGLLIAIIGLSVLPAAAVASIWGIRPETGPEIGGEESLQGIQYNSKSIMIDGKKGPQEPKNQTAITETPKRQTTKAPALPRGVGVPQRPQANGGTPVVQGQQDVAGNVVAPNQTVALDEVNSDEVTNSTSDDLGLYYDSACTQTLTPIDWGAIYPGENVTRTIYIKNMGTNNLTLSLSAINWNPASASGPLTLTWNREGSVLEANQVIEANLKLAVSADLSGLTAFSFDLVVSGIA